MAQVFSSLGSPPADPTAKIGVLAKSFAKSTNRFRTTQLIRRTTAGVITSNKAGMIQLLSGALLAKYNGTTYLVGIKGENVQAPIVVGIPESNIICKAWVIAPSMVPDDLTATDFPMGDKVDADIEDAADKVVVPKDARIGSIPVAFLVPFGHKVMEENIWTEEVYNSLKAGGSLMGIFADALRK